MKSAINTAKKSIFPAHQVIKWVKIEGRLSLDVNETKIRVKFTKSVTSKNQGLRLNIYIGTEILKTLGWEYKDRIVFYHNSDNIFHLMAIKTDQEGYKITNSTKSYSMVGFIWTLCDMSPTPAFDADFEILDNGSLTIKFKP